METPIKKILKIDSADSYESLVFEIIKRLKLFGWQFSKLGIKEKLQKYLERHPDKVLVIELYKSQLIKNIRQNKSRMLFQSRTTYPPNYEIGNPINRWNLEFEVRTEKDAEDDEKQIALETESEFQKVLGLALSISTYCELIIVE